MPRSGSRSSQRDRRHSVASTLPTGGSDGRTDSHFRGRGAHDSALNITPHREHRRSQPRLRSDLRRPRSKSAYLKRYEAAVHGTRRNISEEFQRGSADIESIVSGRAVSRGGTAGGSQISYQEPEEVRSDLPSTQYSAGEEEPEEIPVPEVAETEAFTVENRSPDASDAEPAEVFHDPEAEGAHAKTAIDLTKDSEAEVVDLTAEKTPEKQQGWKGKFAQTFAAPFKAIGRFVGGRQGHEKERTPPPQTGSLVLLSEREEEDEPPDAAVVPFQQREKDRSVLIQDAKKRARLGKAMPRKEEDQGYRQVMEILRSLRDTHDDQKLNQAYSILQNIEERGANDPEELVRLNEKLNVLAGTKYTQDRGQEVETLRMFAEKVEATSRHRFEGVGKDRKERSIDDISREFGRRTVKMDRESKRVLGTALDYIDNLKGPNSNVKARLKYKFRRHAGGYADTPGSDIMSVEGAFDKMPLTDLLQQENYHLLLNDPQHVPLRTDVAEPGGRITYDDPNVTTQTPHPTPARGRDRSPPRTGGHAGPPLPKTKHKRRRPITPDRDRYGKKKRRPGGRKDTPQIEDYEDTGYASPRRKKKSRTKPRYETPEERRRLRGGVGTPEREALEALEAERRDKDGARRRADMERRRAGRTGGGGRVNPRTMERKRSGSQGRPTGGSQDGGRKDTKPKVVRRRTTYHQQLEGYRAELKLQLSLGADEQDQDKIKDLRGKVTKYTQILRDLRAMGGGGSQGGGEYSTAVSGEETARVQQRRRHRRGKRPATRADLQKLVTILEEKRGKRPVHDLLVPPMRTAIPAVVPVKKAQPGLKVIQKVNVEQAMKTKKNKVTGVTAKRKEYNKLKKTLLATFLKAKKASYSAENDKIKKIPSKERKTARQKLRQELQDKLAQLKKRLPSAAKLKRSAIDKLISAAKQLKW